MSTSSLLTGAAGNVASEIPTAISYGLNQSELNDLLSTATTNLSELANTVMAQGLPDLTDYINQQIGEVQSGNITPATAMAAAQQATEMYGVQVPANFTSAVNQTLTQEASIANTGYTPVQRAAIQQSLNQVTNQQAGEEGAIGASAAAQDQYGTGQKIAAEQNALQGEINNADTQVNTVNANAYEQALSALQAEGTLGLSAGEQSFSQNAATAQAQDAINSLNTQLSQQANLANASNQQAATLQQSAQNLTAQEANQSANLSLNQQMVSAENQNVQNLQGEENIAGGIASNAGKDASSALPYYYNTANSALTSLTNGILGSNSALGSALSTTLGTSTSVSNPSSGSLGSSTSGDDSAITSQYSGSNNPYSGTGLESTSGQNEQLGTTNSDINSDSSTLGDTTDLDTAASTTPDYIEDGSSGYVTDFAGGGEVDKLLRVARNKVFPPSEDWYVPEEHHATGGSVGSSPAANTSTSANQALLQSILQGILANANTSTATTTAPTTPAAIAPQLTLAPQVASSALANTVAATGLANTAQNAGVGVAVGNNSVANGINQLAEGGTVSSFGRTTGIPARATVPAAAPVARSAPTMTARPTVPAATPARAVTPRAVTAPAGTLLPSAPTAPISTGTMTTQPVPTGGLQRMATGGDAMPYQTVGRQSDCYTGDGDVDGPGTSTSDSIPARLSDGEYVINAKSADKYKPLVEAINDDDEPGVLDALLGHLMPPPDIDEDEEMPVEDHLLIMVKPKDGKHIDGQKALALALKALSSVGDDDDDSH